MKTATIEAYIRNVEECLNAGSDAEVRQSLESLLSSLKKIKESEI